MSENLMYNAINYFFSALGWFKSSKSSRRNMALWIYFLTVRECISLLSFFHKYYGRKSTKWKSYISLVSLWV